MRKTFSELNRTRCVEGFNHKLEDWSLSDWFVALLGELGEAANAVKKLNRIRDGIPNTKGETEQSLLAEIADELADTDIYLDLVYQRLGLNRTECVLRKFNDTTTKRGLPAKFLLTSLSPMESIVVYGEQPADQAERADGAMPMGGDRLSYTPPAAPNPNFVTTNPGAAAIHPSPDEFTEAELAADPILRFFHYKHLPPVLREVSAPFCQQARGMIDKLPRNAERTVALRKLLEAKDCAVRASLPTP